MTKCVVAAGVVFLASDIFPESETIWCLISAVLVLSPIAKDALPLAITRIQANLVGSIAVLLCLPLIRVSPLLTICLAYSLSIVACHLFRLMTASRSALAAVTIIVMAPRGLHLWEKPLERLLAVVAGCVVGLIITLAIHRRISGPRKPEADEDGGE